MTGSTVALARATTVLPPAGSRSVPLPHGRTRTRRDAPDPTTLPPSSTTERAEPAEAGDVVRGNVLRLHEPGQGDPAGVAGTDAEHHREEGLHHAGTDERAEHAQRIQRVLRRHQVDDRRGVRAQALRERRVLLRLGAVDRHDAAVAVDRVAHVALEEHALAGTELGDDPEAGAGVGLDAAVSVAEDRRVAGGGDVLPEARAALIAQLVAGQRDPGGELPAGGDLGELAGEAACRGAGDHRPPQVFLPTQRRLEDEVRALVLLGDEAGSGLRELGGVSAHREQNSALHLNLLVGTVEGGVVGSEGLSDLAQVGSAAGDRRGSFLVLVLLLERGFGLLVAPLDLFCAGDGEAHRPVDVDGELVDVGKPLDTW